MWQIRRLGGQQFSRLRGSRSEDLEAVGPGAGLGGQHDQHNGGWKGSKTIISQQKCLRLLMLFWDTDRPVTTYFRSRWACREGCTNVSGNRKG